MNEPEVSLAYSAELLKVELPALRARCFPMPRDTPTASDSKGLGSFEKLPSDHEQSWVNPSPDEQAPSPRPQ